MIGRVFHRAGAKHVICIKKAKEVGDEASILFMQYFYGNVFGQKNTVC